MSESDFYWWQYWAAKVHKNFRIVEGTHDEFDVSKMRWGQGMKFTAFFEALGVGGRELQRLKEDEVYKFDVIAEGCDAFVDKGGRLCLAKTAYHARDADGVTHLLRRLSGHMQVETYLNGPKPYVWIFRCQCR